MTTITVLHGRGIVPGVVEGEALVSHQTVSGWGGIDPERGVIIERRHELFGQSFAGRILVFPGAKGSSGWSGFFQATRLMGSAPLGMIFTTMSTKAALGAVVTRVPTVTALDRDPLEVIRTGDRVRIDADHGIVEVRPAAR
jgi:predicted aconitase with swiveling domain